MLLAAFSRREFLQNALSAGAFLLADGTFSSLPLRGDDSTRRRCNVCLFSNPLEKLSYTELAEFAAELGIEGIDLTARTPGHVSPEKVAA